jgi:hypothetical protein
MQNRLLSKLSLVATLAVVALLLTTAARAQTCSDVTLRGSYGYHAEGSLNPVPNVTLTFRSIGMTRFDGNGHLTWVEHTVVGGVSLAPGFTAASGTYQVNANCTGTAVINTPNSPVPLHLSFIVVKEGKEAHSVLSTDAVSTEFERVDE